MTADSSDRLLVSRLLRGDEEAFSHFFDSVSDPLFRFAAARTSDADEAEAIVRTALLEGIRTLDDWRAEEPIATWFISHARRATAATGEAANSHDEAASAPPDPARVTRVREVVHAEWQRDTTERAKKRVVRAALFGMVLALLILYFNCPRPLPG